MKWKNHRAVTAAACFALSGHLLPVIISIAGSTFPDNCEGSNFNSPEWKKNHRTISHYWPIYAFIFLLSFFFLNNSVVFAFPFWMMRVDTLLMIGYLFFFALQWFSFGALLHILEDLPCGGVPLITPYKRNGHRLFYVGSDTENIFAFGIICICLGARLLFSGEFYYGF